MSGLLSLVDECMRTGGNTVPEFVASVVAASVSATPRPEKDDISGCGVPSKSLHVIVHKSVHSTSSVGSVPSTATGTGQLDNKVLWKVKAYFFE